MTHKRIPGLALVQAEIVELERQLEAMREDGRENPSTWGDLQPARELAQLRLQDRRERAAEMVAAALGEAAPCDCGFAALDPMPHRQHYTPEAPRAWKVSALCFVAVCCVLIAMALHAAGVLKP